MSGSGGGDSKGSVRKFPVSLDRLAVKRPSSAAAPSPARPALRPPATPVSNTPLGPRAPTPAAPPATRAGTTLRPQAPLHHAAQIASAKRSAPSGLGLDSQSARMRMVERLCRLGIRDEATLAAMAEVPRHRFVDAGLAAQAYEDTSLPIGLGQTISKPSVVARMIEMLMSGPNARAAGSLGRVLEIGTGCGYQAAVLSNLAKSVLSIERLRPLHEKARELLAPFRAASTGTGGANIRLVYGDGMVGHGPSSPYDSIVSAAGGERLPQAWLDQLSIGGRLVAPMHDPMRGGQVLVVIDRTDAGFERSIHEAVHFVPLKSGVD